MKIYFTLFLAVVIGNDLTGQTINATTYPFTVQTGVAPEDMSTGTTLLLGPGSDNGSTTLQNIGFDFWLGGIRYTQYSVSANGYIRLGSTIASPGTTTDITNSLASFNQAPCIAPYWDDIRTGVVDGKVHVKTIGSAPNRKLVVEWYNVEIPKFESIQLRQFQLWLSETTGKIEFVYGRPGVDIPSNTNTSGASIGFNRTNTLFASVSSASNTVSYTTANNSNTSVIASGTKYSFTPPIPNAPTNLNFTAVAGLSMTMNWTDNATNEIGYAVYRSDDGGNTYQYLTQLAANTVTYAQSSLQPATTYFYKIFAVTEGGMSEPLSGSQTTASISSTASNGTGGGNWSNPATWENGQVPTDANNVIIKDGDVVTIDISANCYNLQVGQGASGILQYEATTARILNVFKSLEIKPGATMQTAASGTVTISILNVYENLLNNGTLDLIRGTTGAALRFIGNTNTSFSGNGSTTNVLSITVAKSSVNQLVEMNLSNFSVRGIANNVTAGFLTLTTGLLKISGTNTFSGTFSSGTPFWGSNAGLWLNNPNFTILGQSGDVNVTGSFRISAGTFNAGSAINNTLSIGGTSNFLLEGGTLNVAGRCSTTVYIQTGGMANICTVGNNTSQPSFDMATGTFTLTGGILKLVKINSNGTVSGRLDYACNANITNFGNGKLVVGEPGVTTAVGSGYFFIMQGKTPPMEVMATNPINSGVSFGGTLNTYGDVTINESANIRGNGFNWYIWDATITNNGTIGPNSRLIFTGDKKAFIYKGTGVCGTNSFPVPYLIIDNVLGLTIDPATANNIIVNDLQLTVGSVTNASKITIGVGGGSFSNLSIGFTGATLAPGNFDTKPTFNIGSGGLMIEYLGPAIDRQMGNEIPASRIVSSVNINNGGANITMAGGNLQVTQGISLTSGRLNLNGDTLTLGSSSTQAGAISSNIPSSYLYNGKFRRWITATGGGSGGIPIGVAASRRLANINFTTLPTSGGTLTTEFIEGASTSNGLPLTEGSLVVNSTSNAGYWRLTAGDGLSGGAYTLQLTASNISGVSDFTQLVMLKRANGASPWLLDGTHVATAGSNASPVLSRTGMSGFGEFAIGMPNAPVPLTTTWTGAADTDWFNAGNWSNGVPGSITAVTIPAERPRYPIVNANTSIKSISIATAASVNVATGINLQVAGN